MFGSACSEDSKSHVVANSVDSHLHIGKSAPELHLGRKKDFVLQNGTEDNHDDNVLIHTGRIHQPLRMPLDTGHKFLCYSDV
jgi:hypothetical protein